MAMQYVCAHQIRGKMGGRREKNRLVKTSDITWWVERGHFLACFHSQHLRKWRERRREEYICPRELGEMEKRGISEAGLLAVLR